MLGIFPLNWYWFISLPWKNDCFWPCFPCRCMEEFKQIATISEKYSGNIREILRLSPFSITDWLPSAQKPSFITFFFWKIYMEIKISSIVNISWIASPPEMNLTQHICFYMSQSHKCRTCEMKVQVSCVHLYYPCANIAHTKKPDFKYLFNAFGHNWTFSDIFELNKFLVTPFQYPAPLRWTLRRGEEAEEGKGRNFLNRPNCNDHTCPDDQLASWKGSHKVFWGESAIFCRGNDEIFYS